MSNQFTIVVTGPTYPVKDKLKALGCRWDAAHKCWMASPGEMAEKAKVIMGKQPGYNSPPPQDLGPIDIAAECAKHGRVPTGSETIPFRRESSKGADETGETFWGKSKGVRNRYLVLRAGRASYLSRDWLEDMDMFSTEPGWYADVQAVAVEPTAEEITNDPAVKTAAEKAKKDARYKIESAVRKVENHNDKADRSGLTKCWGKSRMAGHEALWSDGILRLVYEQSDYDMGPSAWELSSPELAREALTLSDPAK